jgi:hypothetical protein
VYAHYSKELNLINYINRAEIVKNFTNFTCGFGGGTIKFWFVKPGVSAPCSHGVLMGSPFFARRKQLTVSNS